jgi:uncharacterized protein DUF6186
VNSHDVTVLGFLLVFFAGVSLEMLARRTRRIPTIAEVLSRAMRSRTGRIGVLVAWAWVGLHFFAR